MTVDEAKLRIKSHDTLARPFKTVTYSVLRLLLSSYPRHQRVFGNALYKCSFYLLTLLTIPFKFPVVYSDMPNCTFEGILPLSRYIPAIVCRIVKKIAYLLLPNGLFQVQNVTKRGRRGSTPDPMGELEAPPAKAPPDSLVSWEVEHPLNASSVSD